MKFYRADLRERYPDSRGFRENVRGRDGDGVCPQSGSRSEAALLSASASGLGERHRLDRPRDRMEPNLAL